MVGNESDKSQGSVGLPGWGSLVLCPIQSCPSAWNSYLTIAALEQRESTGRGLHQPLSQPALLPAVPCLIGNSRISSGAQTEVFLFGKGWREGQEWSASPMETAIRGPNPSSQFLRIQSPRKHRKESLLKAGWRECYNSRLSEFALPELEKETSWHEKKGASG